VLLLYYTQYQRDRQTRGGSDRRTDRSNCYINYSASLANIFAAYLLKSAPAKLNTEA